MATLTILNQLVSSLGENRIRIQAEVEIVPSATESRLEIPNHLWIKLYQRDGPRDAARLFAEWQAADPRVAGDPMGAGWVYVGSFVGRETTNVDTEVEIGEDVASANEGLYVVAASRPDIHPNVAYSVELWRLRSDAGPLTPVIDS